MDEQSQEGGLRAMSLTSHLNNPASPIGQFIKHRFAQTARLTKTANPGLKSTDTIHPTQADGSYPYGLIGMAIDYRIRYAFDITPYQRLVAWQGALELTTKPWESDDDTRIDWENIPMGVPLPVDASGNLLDMAEGPYQFKLVKAFFDNLDVMLQALQPVGRRLEPEAERTLDRYCIVLSLFEQVYRSDAYLQGPLMQPTVKHTVEALLAIPQESWVDDLGVLFTQFYNRHHSLLSKPHILNPTFIGSAYVGGADADLVVDGCLIDIKTSTFPQIKAEYLHQLAGYLLLDFDDKLHIDAVGIYMARQGELVQWPALDFLHELTGESTILLTSLRQDFRILCQTLRTRPK